MATKRAKKEREVVVDLEELAPRDLVNDPAYLRALLRGTWRLLPEDVTDGLTQGTPEDAQVLADLVEHVLEEEVERGYVEIDSDEDDDGSEDDGSEDDSDDLDGSDVDDEDEDD